MEASNFHCSDARAGTRTARRSPVLLLAILALTLATITSGAAAQDVRSLGMGRVGTPTGFAAVNPAFAAIQDEEAWASVPLPLGALGLLRVGFDTEADTFDLLTLLDQGTHLTTYVFNPAHGPEEVTITIGQDGQPVARVETAGGSQLQITSGNPVNFSHQLQLPIAFPVGPVVVGVRPFVTLDGVVRPDEEFSALFGAGTRSGSADGDLKAEAGVGINVAYATQIHLPEESEFNGDLFVGVRAEPYIGLAKVDATGSGSVTVTNTANADFEFEYEAQGFYSLVGQTGLGFGATFDLGVAAVTPLDEGDVTVGMALTGLGGSFWQGQSFELSGDQDSDRETTATDERESFFFDRFGVQGNVAFDADVEALAMEELASLLVAAEMGYSAGNFSTHVGGEAGFTAGDALVFARAGVGYEAGFVFGVGTGVRYGGFGVDAALHGYRSPLSANQAVGASLGLSFAY